MRSTTNIRRALYLTGIALLFALSLAKFAYDVRWLTYPVNDLTVPWVASRAFIDGKNPYNDNQEFGRIWATTQIPSSAGCPDFNCILHLVQMAYPPTALPILAPLAMLNWKAAVYTYLVGSTALVVAMIFMLAQNLRLHWSHPRRLYLIAFALAMAPLHSGIHQSNPNTLVFACLAAGVLFMNRKPYLSGIALAIAMCLKPPVVFLFFAYPWLRRKWKTAFTALAACAAITSTSLLWMQVHHVAWLGPYLDAVASWSALRSARFDSPGLEKFQNLNLQVLAFQLTHSPLWSNIVVGALFAILSAASAFLIYTRVSEKTEAIGIAIVAVLTLLPVYQKIYTAAILIFVLYWAVENWPRRGAKAAIMVMLPLLLPLAAITQVGELSRFVQSHNLGSYFLWNAFFMPIVIWIELFLLLILLPALYRTSKTFGGEKVA
jgi:Glycosyltransferase family 87